MFDTRTHHDAHDAHGFEPPEERTDHYGERADSPLTTTGDGEWSERQVFSSRLHHFATHAMALSTEVATLASPAAVIDAHRTKKIYLDMLRSCGRRATRSFLRSLFAGGPVADDALQAISQLDVTIRADDTIVVAYQPELQLTVFAFPRGEQLRFVGQRFMRATWKAWFANPMQPELGLRLTRNLRRESSLVRLTW